MKKKRTAIHKNCTIKFIVIIITFPKHFFLSFGCQAFSCSLLTSHNFHRQIGWFFFSVNFFFAWNLCYKINLCVELPCYMVKFQCDPWSAKWFRWLLILTFLSFDLIYSCYSCWLLFIMKKKCSHFMEVKQIQSRLCAFRSVYHGNAFVCQIENLSLVEQPSLDVKRNCFSR